MIYASMGKREVSWFEGSPAISLALIEATGVPMSAVNVDFGGDAVYGMRA
jgi:hypothetical protein